MKYSFGKCPVISKKKLNDTVYDFIVYCPEAAEKAVPGQFANIAAEGFLLRRPISICGIDKKNGALRFVMEVRGKGTNAISKIKEGDDMDILAPLGGRGFNIQNVRNAMLIGGGIGTPPLLPLAEIFKEYCSVITGFRNSGAVILQEDFSSSGAGLTLCTDDGSAGEKGFVVEALDRALSRGDKPDMIYACGPEPMLKAVALTADKYGIPCQVSLEERMGCGIGACLVCACAVNGKNSENGAQAYSYAHVCKDGPVFFSKEVAWSI